MPCREVETAVLLQDMREPRGMMIRMQVVYQETSPQGWAREAPPGQTLRMAARPGQLSIQVVSQNERVALPHVEHFHHERNHQGKDNVLLFPVVRQDTERQGPMQCRVRLGGLLKYYTREAARVF